MFWGHVLEVFANGIRVSAVQNTTPELLRIGPILSVCFSDVGHTVFRERAPVVCIFTGFFISSVSKIFSLRPFCP